MKKIQIAVFIAYLCTPVLYGQDFHEDILPFDVNIMNHSYAEMNNINDTYTPIVYEPYFKAERAMFDYYPKFNPTYVSFDPDGKAYLAYGSTKIQTLDEQNQWVYVDIEPYLRDYIFNTFTNLVSFELRNSGTICEPIIRFDNAGDAYILFHGLGEYQSTSSYYGILLYCRGGILSDPNNWSFYVLPYAFARFEKLDGHNQDCLNRPPVILLSSAPNIYGTATNYILIPEKDPNGALKTPLTPVQIDTDSIMFSYHSGDGNSAITKGNKVFIVYGKPCPDLSCGYDGVPTYAVTYDISAKQIITEPNLLGYGGDPEEMNDVHNWPGITIDSDGILHVVINGHNKPFYYVHSLEPNKTDCNWTEPFAVSDGTTYGSINCDIDNTLYVVTRNSYPFSYYYFKLTLHRKKAGQSWENDKTLVEPYMPYYRVYRHKVSLDPKTQRLFLGYYSQGSGIQIYKDDYLAYIHTYPDMEKPFYQENPSPPISTILGPEPREYRTYYSAPHSEFCILVSNDGGDSWRLVETNDFITSSR